MTTSSTIRPCPSRLEEHARLVDNGIRLFDLGVLVAVLPVALQLRDLVVHGDGGPYPVERYAALATTTLLVWLLAAWGFQVYDVRRIRPLGSELGRLLRAGVGTGLGITALGFVAKQQPDASRLLVVIHLALTILVLVTSRATMRFVARLARRRGFSGLVYAVVGTGASSEEMVEHFAAHPDWGYSFAGHVLMDGAAPTPGAGRVLGRISELEAILQEHVIDEVVFTVRREGMSELNDAIATCGDLGVSVRVCLDMLHVGPARMSVEEVGGVPTLSLTRTTTNAFGLVLKRGFDVGASFLALLLLSPILVATAIAIRIDSSGPVFFRQRRVGQNGRTFDMLKFRSMHADAELRLESLRAFNEMSGPVFKMTDDPRITRVGRFIRRTSIDELPQFLNVLRGEMSVVGPRPPVPAEVKQYQRWQRRRLSVKPGITCTWQVSGRSDIDFEQWMKLDLAYIDNWSLWHDVRIVARTIPAVLWARGAH